jgi:TonB family protein
MAPIWKWTVLLLLSSISFAQQSSPVQGEQISSTVFLYKVTPEYPKPAKRHRIQGKGVLQAVIGKDGHIRELTPISGPDELIPSAVKAVRQWVYQPFVWQGNIVEVDTQITVTFTLGK